MHDVLSDNFAISQDHRIRGEAQQTGGEQDHPKRQRRVLLLQIANRQIDQHVSVQSCMTSKTTGILLLHTGTVIKCNAL